MKPLRAALFYSLFVVLLGFQTVTVRAADYEGLKVTLLKKSTAASNGQPLAYPKTDSPEVTALIVEIPPGAETGWHYHPYPVYAYMMAGTLTVEMEGGEKYTFHEGDVIFEVLNTGHNGRNTGTVPARLLVFYTGEKDKPTTVKGNPK